MNAQISSLVTTPDSSNLIWFFGLAFLFTWSAHLAIPILDLDFSLDLSNPATALYMLGLLGPLIAAVLVLARSEGRSGVITLLKAGIKWRMGWVWFACSVLTVPLLRLVNLGAVFPDLEDDISLFRFEMLLVVGQIWVVVGEEYGWRGYALPRLQRRFGSLGATLILGVLWSSWHLPMFFVAGSPQYTDSFATDFMHYTFILLCWSTILTLLYNRTRGSVLSCMIFHAMLNIVAFSIYIPASLDLMSWLYVPVVLLAIVFLPKPRFGVEEE